MEMERRFVFRGSAAAAGGRISRPKDIIIDATGASALTVSGGRSRGALARTSYGGLVSVGSAETLAEGIFDDRKLTRALTYQRVREDALTTTSTVRTRVRDIVVGKQPALRVEELRAALTAGSPRTSGEPSIRTKDLRIGRVDIDGHVLVVEVDTELFDKYDTRAKLLTAADKPAFVKQRGACLVCGPVSAGRGAASQFLTQSDGTIYASVVRAIRWRGKPYPNSVIDGHMVLVPGFGQLFFGEIFISAMSRRLTMMRLRLGSPVGGFLAFSEVETNGTWYP
jgi:hypothetical protein